MTLYVRKLGKQTQSWKISCEHINVNPGSHVRLRYGLRTISEPYVYSQDTGELINNPSNSRAVGWNKLNFRRVK